MAWHGNPLQYSCLEIPIDWGAWRATVYRVKKSHTQLKQLSMHTLFHYKGCSLVPGWGSKISDAEQHSQKIFFFKLLGINETNFQHLHEMGAKAHLEESQTRQTATAKGNDAPSVLTRTLLSLAEALFTKLREEFLHLFSSSSLVLFPAFFSTS